jgi:hypothetical protein
MAMAATALLWWAWTVHPERVIAAGITTWALTAAWWWLRHGRRRRKLTAEAEPTALYQHWFHIDHVRPGKPVTWYGYSGISNRPDLRRAQHAAPAADGGSWWYPLCDHSLYEQRWFDNRWDAERAERATIREYRGIGNTVHNPDYRTQWAERTRLRREAALLAGHRRRIRLTRLTRSRRWQQAA